MGNAKNIPARDVLLLPYQAKWVRDDSRLKIAEKSRQIGWTWSEGYRIVREKGKQDAQLDHWISSRDDIQARLFLEDCKGFSNMLEIGAEAMGEQLVDEAGHNAYVIRFANGLRAHSMSSNPDAQAGKRGGRTLDEFALHPDPRKLYQIAYPGITWGGSLSIFSTHRGSYNFFNELIQEIKHKGNPKGFSLHTVTLETALDQGLLYKLQSKLPAGDERQDMDEADYYNFTKSGCADEESFMQEYMCVPADDKGAFLSYDLIAGCEYPVNYDWQVDLGECQGELYAGIDVGRDHDLTVLWIVEKYLGVYHTRLILEMKNETFTSQEQKLWPIISHPNVKRVCIDQNGIGRQLTERTQEKLGRYKVEGVKFTGPSKEEMAYPVKAAFEDKAVRIPNDKFIRSDLRSIKKDTTASGNIRFTADHGKNGHADRFWALALAIHGGSSKGDMMMPKAANDTRHRSALNNRRSRRLGGC